jgi:hypothetical protein
MNEELINFTAGKDYFPAVNRLEEFKYPSEMDIETPPRRRSLNSSRYDRLKNIYPVESPTPCDALL